MAAPLRFGVTTGQARPFGDLLSDWRRLDALGFDNAWLIDHVAPAFAPDAPWLDSWTALAALALGTERIRVGVAMTNVALRNPGILCKQAITVDQISNGRLEVAIGAGFYEDEQRMLGIEYPDGQGRAERLREAAEILDVGLRGERVTLKGRYWQLDNLPTSPGSAQQPRAPLWVAAQGDVSLLTAARHADVLVTMGTSGEQRAVTLSKLRKRFDRFMQICTEAGRDAMAVRRAYLVGWSDDGALDSREAVEDLLGEFAAVGVTDFLIGLGAMNRGIGPEGVADVIARSGMRRTNQTQAR